MPAMVLAMWVCSLGRAAEWTDHLVSSQFVSTNDFPLAGIDVRVDVQGLGPLWLQLDTGVAEALLLHGRSLSVPAAVPVPSNPSHTRFAASGQIGEHHFRNEPALVDSRLGATIDVATQKAGSVGVAAFDGSWLVLDLAGKRVGVLTSEDEALEAATCWADLSEERGTYLLAVEGVGRLMFDTGSAPNGVWTNPKGFEVLTGKKPDPSMKVGTGYAFGTPITVIGAPSQVDLRAGQLELGRPLVTFVPEKPSPDHAGILGLAPFEGHVIVLDLIRERLGRVGPCASGAAPTHEAR
jgi:hypothetical protein